MSVCVATRNKDLPCVEASAAECVAVLVVVCLVLVAVCIATRNKDLPCVAVCIAVLVAVLVAVCLVQCVEVC